MTHPWDVSGGFCAESMDPSHEREHAVKFASEPQHSVEHPINYSEKDRWPFESVPCRLPTDSAMRKHYYPMATGLLDYFPDALADVARCSKISNEKHNPGEPLHWSRAKSSDHADTIIRHMTERGSRDTDGVLHDTKVAWRALAQLQLAIERERAAGRAYP